MNLAIKNMTDYFPYGKVIREYVGGDKERYLTTQHERDAETGLDYRGARYYDSDVARFLSLDPLAAEFSAWSAYNYVMSNPIMLIDPTGMGPEDWVQNIETGEYIWDNTVTNQFQAHEGQRYIGKEDSDIIKDLFGKTSFSKKTWNSGTTGSNSERNGVATTWATVWTTLSTSIRANISYDGINRTFNGIDFYISSSGTTSAPLQYNQQMAFTATDVRLDGNKVNPLPEYGGNTIKAPASSGGYKYSWSSEKVYAAHSMNSPTKVFRYWNKKGFIQPTLIPLFPNLC